MSRVVRSQVPAPPAPLSLADKPPEAAAGKKQAALLRPLPPLATNSLGFPGMGRDPSYLLWEDQNDHVLRSPLDVALWPRKPP